MNLLKDWKELLSALGMVILAAVVMKASQLAAPDEIGVFFAGWLLATGCGEAMWLAWGGANLLWRLIIVGFGMVMLTYFWAPDRDVFKIALSTTLASSVLLAIPRLIGIHRCRLDSDNVPQAIGASRQFSISNIFIWITSIALVLGV